LYRRKIKLNHEFLADETVIKNKRNIQHYQTLLINAINQKMSINAASNFNYLITKKRFIMMTKTTSKKMALCKRLALIPVFFAAICMFSSNTVAQNLPNILPQQPSENVESDSLKNAKTVQSTIENKAAQTKMFVNEKAVKVESDDEEIPFALVEVKPKFQGGDANLFQKWVMTQIKYPDDARNAKIQGKVMLRFTVGKDGLVKNVKVTRKIHPSLDAEAVRVLKLSPEWTPGRHKNKSVPVIYDFPINFMLGKDAGKISETKEDKAPVPKIEELAAVGYGTQPKDNLTQSAATVYKKKVVTVDTDNEEIPFALVDEKPKFQGGDANMFQKWIMTQVKYPEYARTARIQGKVMLRFTVDKSGKVKDVIVTKKVHPLLDAEAVRVLNSSPEWTPGVQKHKPVAVVFDFPINFQLN
jgi:TonB family protein